MPAPTSAIRRPELLAPAGSREMIRAAIENGADAVYFGVQEHNARLRAENLRAEELPELMASLHERGVKGYLTLNTLIFGAEVEGAAELLIAASRAGVDAVLIQDLGLAALAVGLVPDLPIHASTQMTLTCAESIAEAEAFGLRLERIVAPRELSRRQLRMLRSGTDTEIEVFVHGALCVAYSGQCLTSEVLGGRSANRGECAQACRLPYDLIVDGKPMDVGDLKYVLSPKDLAALEDLGDLAEIGIASLKIEGRLKSPEYVAATVQSYRGALDAVFADPARGIRAPEMSAAAREKLEMTFSRGFTGGFLHEIDHQAVVEGRFPKKRGLYLGRVSAVSPEGITVALEGSLKPGDGVVFDAGRPAEDEQGGRVYYLLRNRRRIDRYEPVPGETPERLLLVFMENKVDPKRVKPGDRVWKTSDPALDTELRASYEGTKIRRRDSISATLRGSPGMRLKLEFRDGDGHCAEVEDTEPAQEARDRPLTVEVAQAQLGRLGDTPFQLDSVTLDLTGRVMVPLSRLNDLRRRGAEALLQLRRTDKLRRHEDPGALGRWRKEIPTSSESMPTVELPRLAVLCRTLEQVEAAVAHGSVATIYTDFEDIRLHREARTLIPPGGPLFAPATLRVMKPEESGIVRKLLEAESEAVLVRNLAAWRVLRELRPGLRLFGDYSLNAANDLTAHLLKRRGLELLTPSYDLNIDQLLDLLHRAPPAWFEVTIHQYMPMFHMEHCVFCRYLSTGTDFTNCGRPCETHSLVLRDRLGFEHPVKADAGCRNTVFNAVAQSASEYLAMMLAAGVRRFRIDFLGEDSRRVRESIDAYLSVLNRERDGGELWRLLRARSKLGVTRGSLDYE